MKDRGKVLLVGATGFIGPALAEELILAGYRVVCGVRNLEKAKVQLNLPGIELLPVNLNVDLDPAIWRRRLQKIGVKAVINNVGIANCFGRQNMDNVNALAPMALYEAVRQQQVEGGGPGKIRVIQISTTAVNWPDCDYFEYPRTKKLIDRAISTMPGLDYVIVRPNIIYEPERGHLLIEQIARMPLVFHIGTAAIQPIHCRELAIGIVRLIRHPERVTRRLLQANGPEMMSWKEIFCSSRRALGRPWAPCLRIPLRLAQIFTELIQTLPDAMLVKFGILTKLDPQTIFMMTRGSTGSNRDWLKATGLTPITLFDAYQRYGQSRQQYAAWLEERRRDHATEG